MGKIHSFQRAVIFFLVILFFGPLSAHAQSESGPIDYSRRFSIKSDILGEERQFIVAVPLSFGNTSHTYPVLMVLDAEDYFTTFAGTVRYYASLGRIPELVVVGVEVDDRWRDYTPTHASIPDGVTVPQSGGGDAFLRFITTELLPFVAENYRTTPFTVLYGHSIAGLFAASSLFNAETSFSAAIATSPSLWWDDEWLTRKVSETVEIPSKFLYLTMGNEGETMLQPALAFNRVLEKTPGLVHKFQHFETIDHMTMPIKTFAYGLEFVFSDWQLPNSVRDAGLKAVLAYYDALSEKYRQPLDVPENVLNRLGYLALNQQRIDEAISIFSLNVKKYPNSANVYDSLGEAFLKKGEREKAIKNYRKSLNLDPENKNAETLLRKLTISNQ